MIQGLYGLTCFLLFGVLWNAMQADKKDPELVEISLEARVTNSEEFQLFFDPTDVGYFEKNSIIVPVRADLEYQTITFGIEKVREVHGLRMDPGKSPSTIRIKGLNISTAYANWSLSPSQIDSLFEFNDQCSVSLKDPSFLELTTKGKDPYFSSRSSLTTTINELKGVNRPILWPFLISISAALLLLFLLLKFDPINLLLKSRRDLLKLWKALWSRSTVFALLLGGLAWWATSLYFSQVRFVEQRISLVLSGTFLEDDSFQVYYSPYGNKWSAKDHLSVDVKGSTAPQLLEFAIPKGLTLEHIRIDLGTEQRSIVLDSISLMAENAHYSWNAERIKKAFYKNEQIQQIKVTDGRYAFKITGNDAYLRSHLSITDLQNAVLEKSGSNTEQHWFAWALAILVFITTRGAYSAVAGIPAQQRPAVALSASFCLLITIPLLSRVLPIEPASYNTEKRALAQRPELEAHNLLDYPERYNAFYSDNFGFRKVLIRWDALVKGVGLGVSPNKESVLFGKEGWLYYLGEGVDAHHRNSELFSLQQLNSIQFKLEHRANWLNAQGIDYYLTIPPLKSTIYPEFLPNRITRIRTTSKLDQLIAHMKANSFVGIIDMRDTLFAAKKKTQVYYKTDTHWNVLGAFYGYRVLIDRIAQDHPEIRPMDLEDFGIETKVQDKADLAQLSGLNDVLLRKKIILLPKKPFNAIDGPPVDLPTDNFFKYEPQFFENDSITELKLVMFRDSYTVYLQPFLSEHFSRSSYLWTPIFHPDVIEVEKPDIVIHQVMERFIDDLLLDDPGEPRYEMNAAQ